METFITQPNVMDEIATLSYGEKQRIRQNMTAYEASPEYRYQERKCARLFVKKTEENPLYVSVPLDWIIKAFEYGTLQKYKNHYRGLYSVGLNTYQILMDSELITNKLITEFETEKNAQGLNQEQSFLMSVSDFNDPVESLTMYPIPCDFTEDQIKTIIEEQDLLGLGKFVNVTFGKHKNTQVRNGFAHVRFRTKKTKEELPDRIKINNKQVVLLKQGEKLYRPCGLCGMRNHEMKSCSNIGYFVSYIETKKQREKEQEEERKNNEKEANERRLEREREQNAQNEKEKETDKMNLIDLLASNNLGESSNPSPDDASPPEFSESSEDEEEEEEYEEITISSEAPLNDAIQLETRSAGNPAKSGPLLTSQAQAQKLKK